MIDENWGKPTTPRQLIEYHAMGALTFPGHSSKLQGRTAMELVAMGKEIPDDMLPGRYIMRYVKPHEREILKQLKPEDTIQGGIWYAKRWLEPVHKLYGRHIDVVLEFDKKIINRSGY